MLNKDSYRTGTCESPVCECGLEEETVIHLFLNCNKYSHIRSDLFNTVEDVCSKLKRNFTIGDKVQLLLAPTNKYNMKKRDYLELKEALFQFLCKTGGKL